VTARTRRAALIEADRYQRIQEELRRGDAANVERPHPLEFDQHGFPVPRR
jgi:hypothetical protein